MFTGPIRNERLQRVLFYAKRIRYLDYKDFDNDLYSKAPRCLITSTIMRLDKLGAFIALRGIHLHNPSCNTMLFPLTSPNLDAVEIRTRSLLESTEIGLASFLQSVASQSPRLRTLTIKGPFTDITLQVLPDFVNLHSLTMSLQCPDLPPHFLKPFASSMPSLRELCIAIVDRLFPPHRPRKFDQPDSTFQTSFPSLETLSILVLGDSIHLENLFSGLDAPLLSSGTIGLFQATPDAGTHIHEFAERNRQVLKDFHNLVINTVNPSLSLVKSFENLRELEVSSSHGAISMSDIVDTFHSDGSWSRFLTKLHLDQTHPFDGMSIAALCFIADACPNLESLEISIHLPEKPEGPVKKAGEERQPHDLEELVFLNLPAVWEDTVPLKFELVSLLDSLFPSMAILEYTGSEVDKPGALATRGAWWRSVQDIWALNNLGRCRD